MTDTAEASPPADALTTAMTEWNDAKKAAGKAFDAAYAAERGLGTRKTPRKPKESAQ